MDPFSEEMIRSYQNDERVNQDWNAKFDQITGMISQSSNEFNKEVKNAMLGYMDMFGIAVVNTNKKGNKCFVFTALVCRYWIRTFNDFSNIICFCIYSGKN